MKRRATGGESCEPERERERGRDKGRGGGMSTERDIYLFVPATQHMTTPRHAHAHAHAQAVFNLDTLLRLPGQDTPTIARERTMVCIIKIPRCDTNETETPR